MKKISLLIFTLVSLFVFTGNVFALTCSYNNYSNSLTSDKISVSYEIDSNGEITKVEGLPVKTSQYNKIKSQVASSGTCPLYAFVGKDGFVYIYTDQKTMLDDQSAFGKQGLNSTVDDSIKKTSEEALNKLSVFCNGVAATKYDYTKCWDEDKVATKYADCKSEVEKLGTYLRSTRSEVRGNAQSGYLDQNSKAFTDMEKVCEAADKNLKDYEKALEYKSCAEYNAAMGGNIKCSTTEKDVENNPYVNGNKNSESDAVNSSDNCGGVFGSIDNKENFAYYLFHAFQIMKFLGPILVVVMSILDLVKITADPKQDDQLQKLGFKTLKRLVYAALIFVLPDLINYLFGLVGLYGTCGIY